MFASTADSDSYLHSDISYKGAFSGWSIGPEKINPTSTEEEEELVPLHNSEKRLWSADIVCEIKGILISLHIGRGSRGSAEICIHH